MTLSFVLTLAALLPQESKPQEAQRPPEPLPVPRTVVMRRGERRIVVDGGLQDWPSAPPLLLDDPRQLSGTQMGAWRGPHDLAARVFLLWDDEDLYLAAPVKDDWHRPLAEKVRRVTEIPSADAIVVTFDPERDTRALGNDDGRKDDREFWLGALEGVEQKLLIWDRYRGTGRLAEGALAVQRDPEKAITTYEARLPWKEILPHGRKPTLRDVLRLQLVVNDYDEVTDTMPQTRIGWTFGSFAERIDPGVFGSIMLVDKLDEADPRLPEFPPPPARTGDPVPGPLYWHELYERFARNPPAVFTAEVGDPRMAGNVARSSALEDFEHQLVVFPRVDFLELQQRVHRRMNREVLGATSTGLPYFWNHALAAIGRELQKPAPERGARIWRLPQGGFLVRSREATFAIDPAGTDLERQILVPLDFVLQTNPHDLSKRNDQLLLRMLSAKRRVFLHLAIHLPGVAAEKLELVTPGKTYEHKGLKVAVLGKSLDDGRVSGTAGYEITWPDGHTLAVSSLALDEEQLPRDKPWDVLLLSAQHPRAQVLGQRARPGLVILDDVLVCPVLPGPGARVGLATAQELQSGLRPIPSILLGPADSLEIHQAK